MCDRIMQEIDKGNFTIGIFLDLSKAFDTVDHDILLKKMKHYGIRGLALDWFDNYLSNRMQYVMVDGVKSHFSHVSYGVPQGSVLGPLLFLLYINDLVNCSSILNFILFADDTSITLSHQNITSLIDTMNKELHNVVIWLQCNKLSLNLEKTKCVLFKTHAKKIGIDIPPIIMDGRIISQVSNINFLGIKINESLSWKPHIDDLCTRLSRTTGVLRRLNFILPRHVLISLYNTLVLPHLTYCCMLWGNGFKTHLHKLFLTQKRAIRSVCNAHFNSHTNRLFLDCKILKICDLVLLYTYIFMYNYHSNSLPNIFNNLFSTNASYHSYFTRHSADLHHYFPKTKITQNSLRCRGIKLWNELNNDIKQSKSVNRFKKLLKSEMFCQYENLAKLTNE